MRPATAQEFDYCSEYRSGFDLMDKRYQIPKLPPRRKADVDRDRALKELLWVEAFSMVCEIVFSLLSSF